MRKTKTRKKQKKQKKQKKAKTRRAKRMWGGNYQTDVTTTNLEGVSVKALKDVTVAGPGFVLSGSAYRDLMESRDRNGTD
jgi:hypothetical protein